MKKKITINMAVIFLDNNLLLNEFIKYFYKFNVKNFLIINCSNKTVKPKLKKSFFIKIKFVYSKKENLFLNLDMYKNYLSDYFYCVNGNKFVNENLFNLKNIYLKNRKKLIYNFKDNENTEFYILEKKKLRFYEKVSKINLFKKNRHFLIRKIKCDYLDINLEYNIKTVKKFFYRIYSKVILLDRDGILNKDSGYVGSIKDFIWNEGAVKAIKFLNKKNYNIFIVSNQSGVARGYFTEKDVNLLHDYIKLYLQERDCFINKIYFSPFHKDGVVRKYSFSSPCRKPGTKLFRILKKEWNIRSKNMSMIGDQKSDMDFAANCNIKGILFKEGRLDKFIKKLKYLN